MMKKKVEVGTNFSEYKRVLASAMRGPIPEQVPLGLAT